MTPVRGQELGSSSPAWGSLARSSRYVPFNGPATRVQLIVGQISVVLNSVSTGMDMAGLCPKYINIIRGSYIMAIIGIATQPWQLLNTADRFLRVLSGFGVFMAPAT